MSVGDSLRLEWPWMPQDAPLRLTPKHAQAMVIVSDKDIQPATTLINIEASRTHFEALINNMSNPQPNAPALGTLNGSSPPESAGDLMGGTKGV